jgi:hypothetical protein
MKKLKKQLFKITLFVGLIYPNFAMGQSTYQSFKGKQYLLVGNQWKVFNNINNTFYNIVNNTITIKFSPSITHLQKSSFEAQNNLILIRSNVLGYHDYQITSYGTVNYIDFANTLENSALTEDVIIPSYGEYVATPNDLQYSQQWY